MHDLTSMGWLPWWFSGKEFAWNAGDGGSIPGSGWSPGERRQNCKYIHNQSNHDFNEELVKQLSNLSCLPRPFFGISVLMLKNDRDDQDTVPPSSCWEPMREKMPWAQVKLKSSVDGGLWRHGTELHLGHWSSPAYGFGLGLGLEFIPSSLLVPKSSNSDWNYHYWLSWVPRLANIAHGTFSVSIIMLLQSRPENHCWKIAFSRWWSGRTYTPLLLGDLRNCNLLLNNHQQENVGSHQRKMPHVQGKRRSPNKEEEGAKSHLESNPISTRDAQRAQTKPVHTRTQRPNRDWVRSAFEFLSVCCRDTRQQWPATGIGALASADLGQAVLSNIESLSRWPTNFRTIVPKKFLTVKKVLGPTTDFSTWRSGKGTENPQGIWRWRPVEFDNRTSIKLGKQTPGGHTQNLVCTRSQEKGAVSPQETESDLPVNVQESLVEACIDSLTSCQTTGR